MSEHNILTFNVMRGSLRIVELKLKCINLQTITDASHKLCTTISEETCLIRLVWHFVFVWMTFWPTLRVMLTTVFHSDFRSVRTTCTFFWVYTGKIARIHSSKRDIDSCHQSYFWPPKIGNIYSQTIL